MTTCKLCQQALTIQLDPDDFNEATSSAPGVPDDLELQCGGVCHFHWQCLLDESLQIAISLACPSCNDPLLSTETRQVLTIYLNEGGIQENLDILPLVTEEAYLDANPAARPPQAFMTMCGEGDVAGIISLLKDMEEEEVSRIAIGYGS